MTIKAKKIKHLLLNFTLIETIIAVAIMAVSITVLLAVSSNSLARIIKAEEAYIRQHELTQAVEYYNIVNFTEPITQDFFDLEKFDITVYLKDPQISTTTDKLNNPWELKCLNIAVQNKKTQRNNSIYFYIIVPVQQE